MGSDSNNVGEINVRLLRAAIRFNSLILGLTGGTIAALVVYLATQSSIAQWGEDSSKYLGLLAVFFPGYSVTPAGAWIGAFWGFVYAGIFSSLGYNLYGRVLGEHIADHLLMDDREPDNPVLRPTVLRLHGTSLGVAMGAVAGLGLFCSTAWLVIRGTAEESVHAALLTNYIPGYSVSFYGGFFGAIELFAIVFLACLLLATVYNKIVEIRHK